MERNCRQNREKVVEKMTELYGTNPADIKASIGPAISVCCYEVDYPCAEHFLNLADLDSSKFVFEKGTENIWLTF